MRIRFGSRMSFLNALGLLALFGVIVFVSWIFGFGKTTAFKKTESITKNVSALSSFEVKKLSFKDLESFFILDTESAIPISDIASKIVDIVPSSSNDTADGKSAAYIGEYAEIPSTSKFLIKTGNYLTGIAVVDFKGENPVTETQVEVINGLETYSYYLIVKDQILIILEKSFLQSHQLTLDEMSNAIK